MKKTIIKTIILIIIVIIISCINTKSYADFIDDAQNFSSGSLEYEDPAVTIDEDSINEVSNFISGILLAIAIIVAIVTTAVLGLNFVVETAQGKARVKAALIPLIVGMVISFGAYAIWRFAISMFAN